MFYRIAAVVAGAMIFAVCWVRVVFQKPPCVELSPPEPFVRVCP
jgi:hypothetical protein